MNRFSLTHLDDHAVLRGLTELVTRDRATTAALLAHIAEVDSRKLYAPAAYPSMHAYCVGELHLSECAAFRRITAARVARQHPQVFEAVADGRVHLAAVTLLGPYLTPANAAELIQAAAHKSKPELEHLLAERFPRAESLPVSTSMDWSCQLVPGRVTAHDAPQGTEQTPRAPEPTTAIRPTAPERYALTLSMGRRLRDKLARAKELLGHDIPSGDLEAVLERCVDSFIRQREQAKHATTSRPQRAARPTRSCRHIPARVRRAVRDRDGDQCAFVGENGRRCAARTRLEYDHITPIAQGGASTVENVRQCCRAHNQHAADVAFGREFMDAKRAAAQSPTPAPETTNPNWQELVPWLRQLGYRAEEAREAARYALNAPGTSLEARIKFALSYFRLRTTTASASG